ncbi:MAG: EthD family reductase [Chloroflexi bacterium]|nr:EthD family reductase [Chloroflexota bacterium]MCI0829216.1 EthD family reductase [Chloroflexota bacterium]MCI0902740.1 EthD family reductase [Chloroflexota bacterium]
MIKVTVLYPNDEGKKFDHGYWSTTHLAIVQDLLGPMGLVNVDMEKGISGTDPNTPAPFIAVGHLFFNTTDEVHAAFSTHGGAVMGDIPNFTDIEPQLQISETLL